MASLTGTKIKDTYSSLIKFEDNGTIDPTVLQQLTDGTGGSLPISVSQVQTVFQTGSIVDFTGTTVNGLPISPSGLEAGSGPDSMESAAFLSPNAANASGSGAIALGNASNASGSNTISLGNFGTAGSPDGIRIGYGNSTSGDGLISMGNRGTVSGNVSVGIGFEASVSGSNSIYLSTTTQSFGNVGGGGSIALIPGEYANAMNAAGTIVIGNSSDNRSRATSENGIAIGKSSVSSANNAVAIAVDSSATADNAVAIGAGITAARNSCVSVNALEIQNSGDALIMYSPNNTAYRVTVSDAGALEVTAV